ncbi:hypothetical protein Ciccas_010642 [Cichlidogyrus casuarinus]|uniref:RING-type domain-containing protein n=1 Tax=Cichlidogyrus casuarinus TaxID=1844966 RepID=A0ABD2PUR4_9PLAT
MDVYEVDEVNESLHEVGLGEMIEELMACLVCFEPFDTEERVPKLLPCNCSRIICQACLENMKSDQNVSYLIS